ncbi:MAG: class I SAM-dependent methyltransferase [Bacteroidetes bacterium]|nr:class I SAM-dependent methyltransferase [Bacteroidota bacterium]MBP6314866.1 class I SAM-dependent methyltransferase [Chitinophagaceae bacterium]
MKNNNPLYNRIQKNKKVLKSFLAQNNITCYRIYDWDMPEYPLCIDVYENKIHCSIYKTRNQLFEDEMKQWQALCVQTIRESFSVSPEDIYIKSRERKKESGQYEKVNQHKEKFIVQENGIHFWVNLSDYVDTGLFLDHRNTRQIVKTLSKGKHILNLFAYTGSFSVYAAMGGAFTTTTVDLSNTYLNWAKENFQLNKIPLSKHQFIKTDVKQWIKQEPSKLYDIIVLDPPTVSKSKMASSTFDVQADHVELINNTLRHLQSGGILFFSNNFRDFILETEKIEASTIENITHLSIPQDFRNKKIHACWKIIK